jgi:hypothetical protein
LVRFFRFLCTLFVAGLVALRVLSDKRHILTKDSNGHVQLWDVLAGQPIQQLGQVGKYAYSCCFTSTVCLQLSDMLAGSHDSS